MIYLDKKQAFLLMNKRIKSEPFAIVELLKKNDFCKNRESLSLFISKCSLSGNAAFL